MAPFALAAVVVELEFFRDDEGNDVAGQAFLEHLQAPDAAVTVLEWVDAFELAVKVDDIVDAAEVVRGLHNIIYVDCPALSYPDCVGLEYIASLVVGEFAALDMV